MVEADGSFLVADRANARVLRFREGGGEGGILADCRHCRLPQETRSLVLREAEGPARCWPARTSWSDRGFAQI